MPNDLHALAAEMRANSERWFPDFHAHLPVPLSVFYAIGMVGEAGEVANVVKKQIRGTDPDVGLGDELADVFVYLLLLADECGVDLIAEYEAKVAVNEKRWGTARLTGEGDHD